MFGDAKLAEKNPVFPVLLKQSVGFLERVSLKKEKKNKQKKKHSPTNRLVFAAFRENVGILPGSFADSCFVKLVPALISLACALQVWLTFHAIVRCIDGCDLTALPLKECRETKRNTRATLKSLCH